MMKYKGYIGRVEYDVENDTLHGEVLGTRDVITFEGSSVEELRRAFRDSVDTYLDFCQERGRLPEKPFSGKFVTRLDPDLHRQIAALAELAGKSLNVFVTEILRQATEELRTVKTRPRGAVHDPHPGQKPKKKSKIWP
jgi:predicted HicB family RNase H-like nuclease